jgi:WD40 repeat protein
MSFISGLQLQNYGDNCVVLDVCSEQIELPREVFIQCLAGLDRPSLHACSLLTHRWSIALKGQRTWHALLAFAFPDADLQANDNFHEDYLARLSLCFNSKNGICTMGAFEEKKSYVSTSLAIADGNLYSYCEWGGHETINVWDLKAGKVAKSFSPKNSCGQCFAVADRKLLFGSPYDGEIIVLDMEDGNEQTIEGHSEPIECLTSAQRDQTEVLFSGSWDHTIKVWDLNSFKCIETLTGHHGIVNCLLAHKHLIFSGSNDCTIMVWDIPSLKRIAVLHGHTQPLRAFAVGHGRLYSASRDTTIKMWDIDSFKEIGTLEGHSAVVMALAVVDQVLISASADRTIRIWDVDALVCTSVFYDPNNFFINLAVFDGRVYTDPTPRNEILVLDFTASHRAVFEELIRLYKGNDTRANSQADIRFLRMPLKARTKILAEYYKIRFSPRSIPIHFNAETWEKGFPLEKAQAIESHLKMSGQHGN